MEEVVAMDTRRPLAIVTPTLDGDVLTRLALAEASFTPGQLQRLLPDASVAGVRRVLKRLSAQGIVIATPVGDAAVTYSLNREHVGANAIIELAQQATTVRHRISAELEGWKYPPRYAAIFGSWARGEATTSSDIDLFLVRPRDVSVDEWDDQVVALERSVWRWTGNDARSLVVDEDRVSGAAEEPVLTDVLREGLALYGSQEWFRKAVRLSARTGT